MNKGEKAIRILAPAPYKIKEERDKIDPVTQEQTKDSILLIQNDDLSEFSLLDVYGMDRQELMQTLSAMAENDKLSIPAYLESKGAWVTEIGNQDTREYGEYHLDVRYNTDTDELVDMKERKDIYDKAMEPINANDVIVKFVSAFESEWEILKITNLSREDVGNLLKDMAALDENAWDGDYLAYLTGRGAEITLLASSTGLNTDMLDLWDFEYDFDTGLTDAVFLSGVSAGGNLAGVMANLQTNPKYADEMGITPALNPEDIKGVVFIRTQTNWFMIKRLHDFQMLLIMLAKIILRR